MIESKFDPLFSPEVMLEKHVKLPEFHHCSSTTWWYACKAIFKTCKVKKNEEKYNLLISNLPASVTSNLLHVMMAKPVEQEGKQVDPHYNLLKEALFQRFMSTAYNAFLNFLSF